MILNKTISLVLPCKNEEHALYHTLATLPNEIDELIVVDNGSTDETIKIAKEFGAKIISERRNVNGIGYGYALASGIKEATGDIIICMDGDGSYPTAEIKNLVEFLEHKKLDFISGNRLPFKNKRKMSTIRTCGVKMLNMILGTLYGYKIKDCLSGMWVFRKSVIDDLTLFEGGWNLSLEIKLNAITNPKIRFIEHTISYHDRIFDSSKQNIFETGIKHTWFLLRTKFFSPRAGISLLGQEIFSSA